jgi:choice-of-anchor B domain-containing protein
MDEYLDITPVTDKVEKIITNVETLMRRIICFIMMVITGMSQDVLAHAEHDKARFVATNGLDQGLCNNRFRPCKTISYALQQANKGDKVLVAQGQYQLDARSQVFDLLGYLVPVTGGYSQIDNYNIQNPDSFTTTLMGVPPELAGTLSNQGFKVIVDAKALQKPLNIKLSAFELMEKGQSASACIEGSAAGFACNNVSLLAHMPLADFPNSLGSTNDIWGHTDLNTQKEYALIGMTSGIAVVDVSDPEKPTIVGSVPGAPSSWRDIKAYQFYDTNIGRWRAYAYSTTEANEGLSIIDLNNLPNDITLVQRQTTDRSAHNIYISNLDYGLNISLPGTEPLVHILGANNFGGALRTYSLADPEVLGATFSPSLTTRANDYSHDASSLVITDARAQTDCVNADENGCLLILDFNENDLRLWDHTDQNETVELSATSYPNAEYTHSGWWSEDKQFVIVQDELDEQRQGLNTTLNIFDISSLTVPTLVGTWTGPTRAIDHNGFVRGNRYYMSNYTRGMTVLDITDPSKPIEVGYFDTFPGNDGANFNGAWGVYPFLPSGIILVSDINSGLYILQDNTLDTVSGSVAFSRASQQLTEGDVASIEVQKTGNNNAQVSYQVLFGSAGKSDLVLQSGELNWVGAETTSQFILIDTLADTQVETDEVFFVRLFDPKNGATLKTPNITTITIDGVAQRGVVGFVDPDITLKEIDNPVRIPVSRMSGSQQNITVNYRLQSNTAEAGVDLLLEDGILTWLDGDSADKILMLTVVNDQLTESQEQLSIILSADDPSLVSNNASLSITIRDDESNLAPIATAGDDLQVNTRQTTQLIGIGTDPEAQDVSYLWQQVSGPTVTINNPSSPQSQFIAPDEAAILEFSFTVIDDFGVYSQDNIVITVIAAATPPTVAPPVVATPSSSGGSLGWALWLVCLVLFARYYPRAKINISSRARVNARKRTINQQVLANFRKLVGYKP